MPTTWERALEVVARELKPWEGRVALFEATPFRLRGRPRPLRSALRNAGPLTELPAAALDHADAEVFLASRLDGERGAFYRERVDRLDPRGVHLLDRRLFELRGPSVMVLLDPEERLGSDPVEIVEPPGGRSTLTLSSAAPEGELVSVTVWMPRRRGDEPPCLALFVGGTELDLLGRKFGPRMHWTSERFPHCPESSVDQTIEIELPPGERPEISRSPSTGGQCRVASSSRVGAVATATATFVRWPAA